MESKVEMSRSFVNELRGFLNYFATKCKGCLYRNPTNCADCPSKRAVFLMKAMDSSLSTEIDSYFEQNPFIEKLACIISAINDAGRPIYQREIKMSGITRQTMFWDLKKMCKRGYLTRVKTDFGSAYTIGPKKFSIPMSGMN